MGNLRLAFFLAYKSVVKGSRWTLALIVLVMSLSFANLILTPSILAGVTYAMNKQQVDTMFANILIDPQPNKYYLDHVGQIMKKLEQTPGVAAVSSHLSSSADFEFNWMSKVSPEDKGQSGNWDVIGIDPASEARVTTVHNTLISGSYLSADDRDKILLGVEIAGGPSAVSQPFLNLGGVRVGDKLKLTYPNGVQREYQVKGIFQAHEAADHLAFVSNKEMTSVLGPSIVNDRASQVLVSLNPGSNEDAFTGIFQNLGINGVIHSWKDYGGEAGGVVNSFDIVASLIGGIGLIVAATVMFIVIYINVANRKRQIGILRAIGISRQVILSSYLFQALLYSIMGIVIGGLAFGYIIKPYFDGHPIDLPVGQVSVAVQYGTIRNAVIGLLLAAILAGVVPVLNITRHGIVKAIWA